MTWALLSFNRHMRLLLRRSCGALLVLSVLWMLGGCASFGSTYKLKQTNDDVSWAMTRYRNASILGEFTAAQEQAVNQAYRAYQGAFNEALQQAHGNYDAPTPPNVTQLADQLLRILDALD
jgi:hypothetical protein